MGWLFDAIGVLLGIFPNLITGLIGFLGMIFTH
jgi:hypothetical protein